MGRLRAAVGDASFVFVVGKGGVGKTTIASALALELADDGVETHLISTDPAHSLHDVLGDASSCSAQLTVEEFDAAAYADAWLAHARASITELIEHGTYLDAEDIAAFTRLALPGMDELMAALRLVDLAGANRKVIVDTAPTGHMLRLLDAGDIHAGAARALRAMADKAAVVASSFAGRPVRLRSESLIDELDEYVRQYREQVLRPAGFIIATRSGSIVEAEAARIAAALNARACRMAATVWTGPAVPRAGTGGACLSARLRAAPPRGCAALRTWSATLEPCGSAPGPSEVTEREPAARTPALPWLRAQQPRVWLIAGKGGVGKTTCAAALALALAEDRAVLLCSADPAGSLTDVLAGDDGAPHDAALRLRVRQIDAAAELQRLGDLYRADALSTLESIGLAEAAALDRRVIDSLWELAPPGVDEIAALVVMLAAAEADETVVLDTAPTGHFLRLLQMPELALDWARQLMRLLVKYGAAASGGAAEALLRLARELRALRELLHDAQRAATLVVTLAEPVVHAETKRLRAQLRAEGIPVLATLVNRAAHGAADDGRAIVAPERAVPPVGAHALREFISTWNIVT